MKKIVKSLCFAAVAAIALGSASCSDWTDPEQEVIQDMVHPNINKDEKYWADLRAYKNSDHAVAFGWFGFWDGGTTKTSTALSNVPDSMDIVSIWSREAMFNLTDKQKKDMAYVQKVKGTKVTFTKFFHKYLDFVPDCGFKEGVIDEANIKYCAKAMADSIHKYNYDGIDLDQEASSGDVFFKAEAMHIFLKELRCLIGSDKLILVDGYVNRLDASCAQYVDYAVAQAYATTSYMSLQSRYDAIAKNFKPEQFIVTENFESYWENGGVTYTDENGNRLPSALGMAAWNPTQGRKGGFGTYHMEYEFVHNPDYKFLRQGIQIQNPAKINK